MFLRGLSDLVDAAADLVAAERGDHPLDLPPMTKAGDIAVVAAALGPRRRLETGVVAEAFDQLRGISKRNPTVNEGTVHQRLVSAWPFPDCRQMSSTDH